MDVEESQSSNLGPTVNPQEVPETAPEVKERSNYTLARGPTVPKGNGEY
jgi:hypothetical protein